MTKTRKLGRSDLELSPFGLQVGAGAAASAPPEVANWCDIPAELESAEWTRACTALRPGATVLARVGSKTWDRSMLTACSTLIERINRPHIDLWQLSMLDVEGVKAGEPFRMMMKLKELGQIKFFSIALSTLKDALWAIEHTPVHSVTLDAEYEKQSWTELLAAAVEAGTGVIATTKTVNADLVRARELLASTTITAFSWPARLH